MAHHRQTWRYFPVAGALLAGLALLSHSEAGVARSPTSVPGGGVGLELALVVLGEGDRLLAGDTLDILLSLRSEGGESFPGGRLVFRWVSGESAAGEERHLPPLLPGDSLRLRSDVLVPYIEGGDTLLAEVLPFGESTAVATAPLPVPRTVPGDSIFCPVENGEIEALSAAGPYLLRVGEGFLRLFDVERGTELPEWTLPVASASVAETFFLFAQDGAVYLADLAHEGIRLASDPAFTAHHPAAAEEHLLWVRDRCGTPGEIVLLSLEKGERFTIPLDGPIQSPPSLGGEWVAWCTGRSHRFDLWGASLADQRPLLLFSSESPIVGPVVGEGGVLYAAKRDSLWEICLWKGETGKTGRIERSRGPVGAIAASGFLCAWSEGAPGAEDTYARDVRGGRRIPVSLGPGAQVMPALGDSSVFWVDRRRGLDDVGGLRLRIPAQWMGDSRGEGPAIEVVWEAVEAGAASVRLGWTIRNIEGVCTVRVYRVSRSVSSVLPGDEVAIGQIEGPGLYFFEDRSFPPVGKREWVNYFVALGEPVDSLLYGPFVVLLPERPAGAALRPAGPNPTREEPRFSISLPVGMEGEPVEVQVYDCSGRLVRRSSEGESSAGSRAVHWDRKNGAGELVGPGVYFLQIRVGDRFQETRKIVLLSP